MNTRRILTAFAAVSLMCGIASASTLEETFTGSATVLSNTDFTNALLTAAQFNPAWGTLISVEIDVTSFMNTDIKLQSTDTQGSNGTVSTNLDIYVQDAGNDLQGGIPTTGAGTVDYNSPTAHYAFGAGGSSDSGVLTATATQDYVYTLAAVLAEYTGTSTYSLDGTTFTSTALSNHGGNTAASQSTNADITGDVIYTYNPPPSGAPEPATLFLMGSALVGVGVLRKRFKA